jgi:uncharacterized membrane protein YfbV (UPF0208 family)
MLLILFLPLVAVFFLPDLRQLLQSGASAANTDAVVAAVFLLFALFDGLLWTLARRSFHRNHLIRLV